MQLLFGTIGPASTAEPIFHELGASSRQSTPGIEPTIVRGANLLVGHVARSFYVWESPDQRLRLLLDGQIIWADGTRQTQYGAAQDELAAIAALYKRHGDDIWAYLDGNFCLIIEDGDTLHIGVDPVGVRTVYWWQADGLLAFHTHLLDLAPLYPGALTEDYGALGNYLATGSYPVAGTPYREIQQLPPGFVLTVRRGTAQLREHYRMVCTNARADDSPEQMAAELSELLSEAIGGCLQAADRPGLLLSGGKDSRYISAEAARQARDPQQVRTITYGIARDLANSDGQVARAVADRLGVQNLWLVVNHDHQEETFARTLYLTSGADDGPITYPDHILMHRELVQQHGFGAIFRGDQCFGRGTLLVTTRGLLPATDLVRLTGLEAGYQPYIEAGLFQTMAAQQADYLHSLLANLRSKTSSARRDELYYGFRIRQVVMPASKLKHADLEVYNPLLMRKVLAWDQAIPDAFRNEKMLGSFTLKRSFPQLTDLPYATARLQGDWDDRMRRDRKLIRFYRTWFDTPGWVDRVGARAPLLRRLDALDAGAETAAPVAPRRSYQDYSGLKNKLRGTWLGRYVRELGLERKLANQTPEYLRIGRLAVVHGLISQVEARRGKSQLQASSIR